MAHISTEAIQQLTAQRERLALANLRSEVERLSADVDGSIEVAGASIRENLGVSAPAWLSRVADLLNTIESEIG